MRWILLPLLLFCGAVWAQFDDEFAGDVGKPGFKPPPNTGTGEAGPVAPAAAAPVYVTQIGDTSGGNYILHFAAGSDSNAIAWASYAETGQSFMYADSTEGHGYAADSTGSTTLTTTPTDTFNLPTSDWGDKRVTWKFRLRDGADPPLISSAYDSSTYENLSIYLPRAVPSEAETLYYLFANHGSAVDSTVPDHFHTSNMAAGRCISGGSSEVTDLGATAGLIQTQAGRAPINDSTNDRPGFLFFDCGDTLAGATIDSVKLFAYSQIAADFDQTGEYLCAVACTLSKMNMWGDAAEDPGDANEAGRGLCYDWAFFDSGTDTTEWGSGFDWTDYDNVAEFGCADTVTYFETSTGAWSWLSFTADAMKEGVQFWADNPTEEGGFMIFGKVDSGSEDIDIRGHHHSSDDYRPYLQVWFRK